MYIKQQIKLSLGWCNFLHDDNYDDTAIQLTSAEQDHVLVILMSKDVEHVNIQSCRAS